MRNVKIVDVEFEHAMGMFGFDSHCLTPTKTFSWDRGTDYKLNDTVIFTTKCISKSYSMRGIRKIAWLTEPKSLVPHIYADVMHRSSEFFKVVSFDREFVNQLDNGIYVPCASTWIDESEWGISDKTKDVSIIYSDKTFLPGHRLRHGVAHMFPSIDRFGSGSGNNIISGGQKTKSLALKDYKFSVVIENERTKGYFTEKLIDSLILGTIPIYWGDPEIDIQFDKEGILSFNSIEELTNILNSDLDKSYTDAIDAVKRNQKLAETFHSSDEILMSSIGKYYE